MKNAVSSMQPRRHWCIQQWRIAGEAFARTAIRPRMELAAFVHCVPTALDPADIRLMFVDVVRDEIIHCHRLRCPAIGEAVHIWRRCETIVMDRGPICVHFVKKSVERVGIGRRSRSGWRSIALQSCPIEQSRSIPGPWSRPGRRAKRPQATAGLARRLTVTSACLSHFFGCSISPISFEHGCRGRRPQGLQCLQVSIFHQRRGARSYHPRRRP